MGEFHLAFFKVLPIRQVAAHDFFAVHRAIVK